jgi:monoamine oxidase
MIPIDESKGTIMISYTDGADTMHYRKLVEKYGDESVELADAVMSDVRRWWPGIRVPAPTYTKAHLWTAGCTYWQPLGKKESYVSADELMARTHRPYPRSLPGVYVAGESYSAGNQCWVEGALETAEAVVKMIG